MLEICIFQRETDSSQLHNWYVCTDAPQFMMGSHPDKLTVS
jgi:hypothetical protein